MGKKKSFFMSKGFLGFVIAAITVGYFKGNPQTLGAVKDAYEGGIFIPGVSPTFDNLSPIVDTLTDIALLGAKIPVVGPTVAAPLVSGTYGILWGWTQ